MAPSDSRSVNRYGHGHSVCKFPINVTVPFEYSSGVREIADELLYRERQFPFESKGFCEWGAKPHIKEFRN